MTANYSDNDIQAMIERARVNAERDLAAAQEAKAKRRREDAAIRVAAFNDAIEIIQVAHDSGYDKTTCKDLIAALLLTVKIVEANADAGL